MYQHQEAFASRTSSHESLCTSVGNAVRTFLPGVVQGATTVMLGHPLDTAKTRLQASGPHVHSNSVLQSVVEIARREGVRGLYRGAAPPILMEGAKRGLQFGLWDIFRSYARHHNGAPTLSSALPSISLEGNAVGGHFSQGIGSRVKLKVEYILGVVGSSAGLSGAVAGGLGTVIGCPMHVIKVQTQNQTSQGTRNAWTCTKDIWNCHGFRGFYLGLKANLLKDICFAGTYLGLYSGFREKLLVLTKHMRTVENNSRRQSVVQDTQNHVDGSTYDRISVVADSTPFTRASKSLTPSDAIAAYSPTASSSFVAQNENISGSVLPLAPSERQRTCFLSLCSEQALTFFAASTACMLTWVLLYPLDTMKTLIQSRRLSSITAVRAARLQPREVYRGLTASLWRAGPIAGVAMIAYENIKERCNAR